MTIEQESIQEMEGVVGGTVGSSTRFLYSTIKLKDLFDIL
jgi:hypothetical protein